MVLTNVTLPIFFIIFLGYLLRKFGRLDERVLSRTQIYVVAPALVFTSLASVEAETGIVLRILTYIAVAAVIMIAVSQTIALLLRSDRTQRHAISLTATFMNSGFYGIPVCLLAFGHMGLVYATIFMVASSVVQSTLGIYIASAGSRSPSRAIATVFKIPIIWAIVLARILVYADRLPPEPLMKMISMLGQAAVPLGLLLLGMQLERIITSSVARFSPVSGIETGTRPDNTGTDPSGESSTIVGPPEREKLPTVGDTGDGSCLDAPADRRDFVGGIVSGMLRIAGGFAIAVLIVGFFDFDPLLKKVIIVESSMPTAVNAVVYATEFNCRPRLVALGILISTLASALSLTLIIGYLG